MDRPPVRAELQPVLGEERIQALDVVRGFALIGILIMNVEFFNLATADLGSGMQPGQAGSDFWISYFVQYFVAGKFWTIFSLLFGMGFAVMLARAERAGRDFLASYLRRVAALAVFGVLHHIFLFSGDILFSYAMAAAALLVVLYGRAKRILQAILACIACAFIPGMDWLAGTAGGLAFFGFAAWWLRGDQRMQRLGNLPVVALVLILAGAMALIIGAVTPFVSGTPSQARFGLPLLGLGLVALGLLTRRYHADEGGRPWRLGVGIYCFCFFMMTGTGASMYFFPEKPPAVMTKEAAEKHKKQEAEHARDLKERRQRIASETAALSKGSYADVVALRAKGFPEHAQGEIGFAVILVGMFLIGAWFVSSGLIEKAQFHLPLFRKLALYGLPLGIGMGLLGSSIAMHAIPGTRGADGFQLASGFLMLGNLPASLGYVSLVILMLHSASPLNKVRLLRPFGRMALTNYLVQSLVASSFFLGYGLGHWGTSRVNQMLFVAVLAIVQIVYSHLWLSRFRYGPLEWLWRAVTYWQIPPMRLTSPAAVPAVATSA